MRKIRRHGKNAGALSILTVSAAAVLGVALAAGLLILLGSTMDAAASGKEARSVEYDVVIKNGRVMDPETRLDAVGVNVGIRGKTIAAVTRSAIRGHVELDAAGRVVAPGFIDTLSYSPNPYGVWFKIADGVTTNLAMHGAAADMRTWYRVYERLRPPLHFGGAFLYAAARYSLRIARDRPASAHEIIRLVGLAERALQDGALGISMSPEYVPGITAAEIVAMMRVARRYPGPRLRTRPLLRHGTAGHEPGSPR